VRWLIGVTVAIAVVLLLLYVGALWVVKHKDRYTRGGED
jgi:hypothetical protein